MLSQSTMTAVFLQHEDEANFSVNKVSVTVANCQGEKQNPH